MLFLFAACLRRTEDTVDWTLARRIIAFIGGNQVIVINGELLRICVNFIGMDNGRWTLCLHVFFILLLALIMELSVHKLCVNTFRFSSLVLLGVIYCLLLVRTNSFHAVLILTSPSFTGYYEFMEWMMIGILQLCYVNLTN